MYIPARSYKGLLTKLTLIIWKNTKNERAIEVLLGSSFWMRYQRCASANKLISVCTYSNSFRIKDFFIGVAIFMGVLLRNAFIGCFCTGSFLGV